MGVSSANILLANDTEAQEQIYEVTLSIMFLLLYIEL